MFPQQSHGYSGSARPSLNRPPDVQVPVIVMVILPVAGGSDFMSPGGQLGLSPNTDISGPYLPRLDRPPGTGTRRPDTGVDGTRRSRVAGCTVRRSHAARPASRATLAVRRAERDRGCADRVVLAPGGPMFAYILVPWLKHVQRRPDLSPATRHLYARVGRELIGALIEIRDHVIDLGPFVRAHRADGHSPRSIALYVTVARIARGWAVRVGMLPAETEFRVPRVRIDQREFSCDHATPTPDQVARVLAAMPFDDWRMAVGLSPAPGRASGRSSRSRAVTSTSTTADHARHPRRSSQDRSSDVPARRRFAARARGSMEPWRAAAVRPSRVSPDASRALIGGCATHVRELACRCSRRRGCAAWSWLVSCARRSTREPRRR
jgi:hypothetical protein